MNLLFLKRKNNKRIVLLLTLLGIAYSFSGVAQVTNSFSSLQQPSFAKIGGLGGVNASLFSNEQGFFIYNPSLLSEMNANQLMLSYGLLPGGAGLANVNYSLDFEKLGTFGASMQYLSYGSIQGYDDAGVPTTSFSPSDYTVQVTHARQANNFRFGASLKFSNTGINGYNGNAVLLDLGGLFVHPEKDFTVGAVIKNFGFVTSEFSSTSNTTLPFDVQLGTSFKPEHMPIRFSITLHQLHMWNLMNDGEEIHSFNTTMDNIFRHVVVGAEIILNENISLLSGYNHLRRKDLKPETGGGFSGISIGFDLNIKAFEFVYALGGYHVAGNNHSFSLAANLSEITTK